MASSILVVKVACLGVLMCMVLGARLAQGAVSCGQVQTTLAPCLAYLTGRGGAVPPPCCTGVRTLNSQAKTTPDRQAACRCAKSAFQSIPALKSANLAGLPGKCGVKLSFKFTLSVDCNMIR